MSAVAGARRQFGSGPLSRVAALVYTLMVVQVLLLASALPGLVPVLFLEQDASNAPLVALCALPLGPAVSAALYALRHRSRDITELYPARAFWRGYRANLRGVLLVWVPWLAWMTILGINLGNFAGAGVPGWWAALLGAVAVLAALWLANALVITSLFAFRAVDVARLAVYFLAATPGVTLGNAGLLLIAAGVTAYASEGVLALLGAAFLVVLLRNAGPMITRVEKEFTA
ncbi:YesL family protein [Phytohabitans rumicis]|uniref:DUF624 domain-containing protein n=1 Tax=Phytohabitans rumicis TaxID=1076125 RepID=A0A6V8L8K1_9ACTN|nr:YesL family protein [Phytohabitans rumicis]GFJ92614.1 hypothetical protein Prum_062560 [Phytohabitans rumicis]